MAEPRRINVSLLVGLFILLSFLYLLCCLVKIDKKMYLNVKNEMKISEMLNILENVAKK